MQKLFLCLRDVGLGRARLMQLESGADSLREGGVALGAGQIQSLLEMLGGFSRLPLRRQRNRQVAVRVGGTRRELEDLLVVSHRLIPLALGRQQVAKIVMRTGIVRVKLEHPLVVSNRFFPLSLRG